MYRPYIREHMGNEERCTKTVCYEEESLSDLRESVNSLILC
jgi:hypothetical protein